MKTVNENISKKQQKILFNKNVLFVITIKHNWKCPEELCTAVSNGKHPQSAWYKEGANSHSEGPGQSLNSAAEEQTPIWFFWTVQTIAVLVESGTHGHYQYYQN